MAYLNSITLTFLLIGVFVSETTEAYFYNGPTTVTIRNNISDPNPTKMTLHCKSKDDDLGFHDLNFGGIYDFTFGTQFFWYFAKTLFYCSFTWPADSRRHYLDVFDQSRDQCHNCSWTINKTGGFLDLHTQDLTYFYEWKRIESVDVNNTFKM